MTENYLNDRVIIPDEIRKMTKEERRLEIIRLEKEAAVEKQRLLQEEQNKLYNKE